MKKLLIVESPSKIKTISKFLGRGFKIMSTMGHIKDLPKKSLGVSLDKTIHIDYQVLEGKEKVIADISKEAQSADEIYLAPDPDREGEVIAWHIQQDIAKVADKDKIHRISFNEITKSAIENAMENQGKIDMKKVAAQQARRVLDRWVGYEVSPILWRKIAPGLSAGRVQSVALRLVCERELEIRNFKPEEYWTIEGTFAQNEATFNAQLSQVNKKKPVIDSKEKSAALVKKLNAATYQIASIEDKQRVRNPVAPFMTSTLQQAAYNRLGFSVKKTMQIAQHLYEGIPLEDAKTPVALITYMRTDSLRLSDTATKAARGFITKQFGNDYLPSKTNVYSKASKSKTAPQDAHEAIRPIDVNLTPDYVSRFISADEAQLYELIWKRFVACQMKPALYAQRQVTITSTDNVYTFKATGSTLIFDGFLKVYEEEETEEEQKSHIPKELEAKKPTDLQKVTPKQHFTQPPPRYTEASLVKELDKEGIGRPSTYSTILHTIGEREYTTLDAKKRFVPTELGMTVSKMLTDNLPNIMDIKFTARLEEDLDKISHGEFERDLLLREFHKQFEKELEAFKGEDSKRNAEPTDITCPSCKKGKLVIRFGKSGPFLGCQNYPDCTFTSNFKRTEDGTIELVHTEAPKLLEERCPQCGKQLRELVGKYGPFIACSGYPECKYIKPIKASFPCPNCGGDIVRRHWRGGTFWGCSNYPQCKFAIFGDIVETPCPQCKLPFLVKKKTKEGEILICNDKECGYQTEVQ